MTELAIKLVVCEGKSDADAKAKSYWLIPFKGFNI